MNRREHNTRNEYNNSNNDSNNNNTISKILAKSLAGWYLLIKIFRYDYNN